jgi:hypothetical protein
MKKIRNSSYFTGICIIFLYINLRILKSKYFQVNLVSHSYVKPFIFLYTFQIGLNEKNVQFFYL